VVRFARLEQGFACLARDGAQVMLEQRDAAQRQWLTGDLASPFGRGINFQIEVGDVAPILARLTAAGWPRTCGSKMPGIAHGVRTRHRGGGRR
jgi:hypothetical protein